MPPTTPKELNEEYDRFWKEQAELLHRRMANDAVREAALGLIREQELHPAGSIPIFTRSGTRKS